MPPDGDVIDPSPGSVVAIASNDGRTNPLYVWAMDHQEPHSALVRAQRLGSREILDAFRRDVPTATGSALIQPAAETLRLLGPLKAFVGVYSSREYFSQAV